MVEWKYASPDSRPVEWLSMGSAQLECSFGALASRNFSAIGSATSAARPDWSTWGGRLAGRGVCGLLGPARGPMMGDFGAMMKLSFLSPWPVPRLIERLKGDEKRV